LECSSFHVAKKDVNGGRIKKLSLPKEYG
jgi:hypothetical protein